MINWQPISTAPLDGTDVLIYDGYDVWKAYAKWDTWSPPRGCYKWYCSFISDDDVHSVSLYHEPTHWLPISDLLKPLGHL